MSEILRSGLLRCRHGFSTRAGGVSTGIFESLNLGRIDTLGDDPDRVEENWRRFGAAIGVNTARFVHGRQVHGNHVHIAVPADAHGIRERSDLEADGYVTNIPGLTLAVFTADCAPLLMEDTDAGVIAAVHCGWRPTAADIMGEAVRTMQTLGADPANIRAAIGPSIRKCCFQTGEEVPAAMEALLGDASGLYEDDKTEAGRFRVDLAGVVKRRLVQLGIPATQIDDSGVCTMCQPERFWSHRRLGLRRGSQANVIML